MKILNVVGARPNFMKIAPLIKEMRKESSIESILVHTGQHYDKDMSEMFFETLNIPSIDYNLNVGSASHAVQTANIMIEFEKVCLKERPDLVLVVGDVNSTLAASLVAKKLHIKVAHVEAGLRSFDMTMPEEINRILTDAISDFLFVTEESGIINLRNEGIKDNKIFFVGNVMIDTLIMLKDKIDQNTVYKKFNLNKGEYVITTLHRPSNVDKKETLRNILYALDEIQKNIPIVLPMHPRTKQNIEKFGFNSVIEKMDNLIVLKPLDYISFMNFVCNCKFILTDSGGIQEEATFLGKPCITLRSNTERPVTIEIGTNVLVGTESEEIIKTSYEIIENNWKKGKIPDLWDGKTARRILEILNDN